MDTYCRPSFCYWRWASGGECLRLRDEIWQAEMNR